ncbi:MAG: hypothetical protein KJZ77_19180, partial [Anaerolineales bacterium]|nr:hypothetical protein [Anaerolineales bacterium]
RCRLQRFVRGNIRLWALLAFSPALFLAAPQVISANFPFLGSTSPGWARLLVLKQPAFSQQTHFTPPDHRAAC